MDLSIKDTEPDIAWRIERACAIAVISHYLSNRELANLFMDIAAPTELEWNSLRKRAYVFSDGDIPDANDWRQAMLETIAWGQSHVRRDMEGYGHLDRA